MDRFSARLVLVLPCLWWQSVYAQTKNEPPPVSETGEVREVNIDVESTQVAQWNRFASQLHTLHRKLLGNNAKPVAITHGVYGGELWKATKWTQHDFYNQGNHKFTSKIRKVEGEDAPFQTLDVEILDNENHVVRDYSVSYLPFMRNAPIQTLINFHSHGDGLHAFRQFDASDRRIYEQCQGTYFGEKIDIRLEDYQIPEHPGEFQDLVEREAYRACFQGLPDTASPYTNPLAELENKIAADDKREKPELDTEAVDTRITRINLQLLNRPDDAGLLLKRAELYLLIREMEKAIADYSRAIAIDDTLDNAYFGRGMAHGRAGNLQDAIADLTVYLKRNPASSRGYTKRGVRYIWAGELQFAESDLKKAIELDATNAEAHDDLGVLLAQKRDFTAAVSHFRLALIHDPGYQKAHHNLALAHYLRQDYTSSLNAINQSLRLNPESRNSLLLKGEILKALGRPEEAKKAIEKAELLPKGNWSEEFGL